MATGDSPPRIPPRDRAQNEARRDPSRPPETGKSWPAQRQPGGDIVKEHGQTRGRDAQEIKPSTALRSQSRLRLEGRARTLSGLSPDLSPARTPTPSSRGKGLLIRRSMESVQRVRRSPYPQV